MIGRENDPDWYEACNPSMPNARGLVPVQFFQVLGRTERDSAGSNLSQSSARLADNESEQSGPSGSSANHPPTTTTTNANGYHRASSSGLGKSSGAMVYGIVMYDFAAERPDELEAKAGEAIIVIAQSNPEWFVAKPIGRLGGPGLIPVSFIEIRDMATQQPVPDPQEAVQRAGVPKVEEWKKMAADYKNSSISLGRFETGSAQRMQQDLERLSLANGRQSYQNGQPNGHVSRLFGSFFFFFPPLGRGLTEMVGRAQLRLSHQRVLSGSAPPGPDPYSRPVSEQMLAPIAASIPRWCFARDKYWYIIDATMEDGRRWELSRVYQDFYDFQINLLREFPEEAGNTGKTRILPFMPGPVTYVTHQISHGRRQNLDEYIKKLLMMPPYISRHHFVRQLFAPRDGDVQVDPEAQTRRTSYDRLSGESHPSSSESPDGASRQSSRGNLNGTSYQPGLSAPPARPNHQRQQPSISNSRAGPGPGLTQAQAVHYQSPTEQQQQQQQLHHHPGITRQISSLTQTSNGSSQATANAPGASGMTGPAVKIKIYHQDDLIAIRVPIEIGFEALKDKIQARLGLNGGGNMIRIQYKDELNQSYERLEDDDDLSLALQRHPSKLTLYVNY